MAKKKYLIDGTSLTRSTDRTYTHAVVNINGHGEYSAKGFCGSVHLAVKLLHTLQYEFPSAKFEIREVHEVIKEKRDQ